VKARNKQRPTTLLVSNANVGAIVAAPKAKAKTVASRYLTPSKPTSTFSSSFGLPRIDQVIDSTAGCDLLCFLDCYSRYHQIAIKEED
jgi:hypothetical protein